MRILASNFGLTIGLVVGLAALGSCGKARADYVPVNSDEIKLADFGAISDDGASGIASSATQDRESKDDPLTPSNEQNGPIVGRDLVSLFSMADGRGSQSGGAGSSSNSHDSGGYGQVCVCSKSQIQNLSPMMGQISFDLEAELPDPVGSRLFRPPRDI